MVNSGSCRKAAYRQRRLWLTALLLWPGMSLAAEVDYGGHLKYFFSYSDFPEQSVFAGDENPYREQLGNLRLKLGTRAANWSGEIHYVMDALYSKDLASCQIRGALVADGCELCGQ